MSKMSIRQIDINTSEDVIKEITLMYMSLIKIVYPDRIHSAETVYKGIVLRWLVQQQRVSIIEKENEIIGFSVIGWHNVGGATDWYLDAEISFVKEEYRKSRAAYIMYKDGIDYAISEGLGIMSTSNPDSSPIIQKRYNSKHLFNHFEISTQSINSINK